MHWGLKRLAARLFASAKFPDEITQGPVSCCQIQQRRALSPWAVTAWRWQCEAPWPNIRPIREQSSGNASHAVANSHTHRRFPTHRRIVNIRLEAMVIAFGVFICIWGFHFSYWKVCLLLMMVMIIVVHLGIQEKMCFVVDDGDDDIAVYPGIQEICCCWWCCSWWYCCISWHPGKFVPISIDLGSLFGCKIVALLFVSHDHHFPMHAFKNQLWNYKIWFVEFCHTFVQLL